MNKMMDEKNCEEEIAVNATQKSSYEKRKVGRPPATIDRTKTIKTLSIKMTDNDFIYCNMLAKEMHEEELCGADVSSLISYFISQSKQSNPLIAKAADAIYELQSKKFK